MDLFDSKVLKIIKRRKVLSVSIISGILISIFAYTTSRKSTHNLSLSGKVFLDNDARTTHITLPAGAYLYTDKLDEQGELGVYSGTPRWDGVFYLPSMSYSKKNLEQLFNWYTSRHPDLTYNLHVKVYCDEQELKNANNYTPSKYPAHYSRNNLLVEVQGEIDEYYRFSPDPNDDRKQISVILNGGDWFAKTDSREVFEQKNGNWRLFAKALTVEAEPPTQYLSFFSAFSNDKDSDMRVMTLISKSDHPVSNINFRFLSIKAAYMYYGRKFAVTVDAGQHWNVWDMKRALSNNLCCHESDEIQAVQLSPEGKGTMTFRHFQNGQMNTLTLNTTDYGVHWNGASTK